MAKAHKCDRCGVLYEHWTHTLSGSVARSAIGEIAQYYPDEFDLCYKCYKALYQMLQNWWKEGEK